MCEFIHINTRTHSQNIFWNYIDHTYLFLCIKQHVNNICADIHDVFITVSTYNFDIYTSGDSDSSQCSTGTVVA